MNSFSFYFNEINIKAKAVPIYDKNIIKKEFKFGGRSFENNN